MGLNVGAGLMVSSGKPLTALAANPVYNSPGEILESVRGAGFDTMDGFLTRTPTRSDTAIHADYRLRVGRNEHVALLADVYNLFNRQIPLDYDPNTETTFKVLNPDFGQPSRFNLSQLETPRRIRTAVGLQVLIEEILRCFPNGGDGEAELTTEKRRIGGVYSRRALASRAHVILVRASVTNESSRTPAESRRWADERGDGHKPMRP